MSLLVRKFWKAALPRHAPGRKNVSRLSLLRKTLISNRLQETWRCRQCFAARPQVKVAASGTPRGYRGHSLAPYSYFALVLHVFTATRRE
jgi:hypothetical protein